MGSSTHVLAPSLLALAVLLVALKWTRRSRGGGALPFLPRLAVARAAALTVAVLVMAAGVAAGQPWAALVPALALGGIAGAAVDRLRGRHTH